MPMTISHIPFAAHEVLAALEEAGFEAWIVGGWVRDELMGIRSHDVDVATSALWRDCARVLRAAGMVVHETGTRHGTITAVCKGEPVEVTTYRVDGIYTDHRRPDRVSFVSDVKADLARRDFTINAMAYHPERGLLDPFGGKNDLEKRLIRAVGNPFLRFEEDALRVLRALRFAARFGFSIEEQTQIALNKHAKDLSHVASERIGAELTAILATGRMGWALREQITALSAALPELVPLVGFDQKSSYHAYDVLEHTARVCDGVEAFTAGLARTELRWAALLHDIAKPSSFSVDTEGRGHFFGHPELGALTAEMLLSRFALPKALGKEVSTLIRMHDYPLQASARSVRRTLIKLDKLCPGNARVLVFDLIRLKQADSLAKAVPYRSYATELTSTETVLLRELKKQPPITVGELSIDGNDVMRIRGLSPGPEVGALLAAIHAGVLEGALVNEREVLLEELKQLS